MDRAIELDHELDLGFPQNPDHPPDLESDQEPERLVDQDREEDRFEVPDLDRAFDHPSNVMQAFIFGDVVL